MTLIEGCQLACALLNCREAAYDRRASCSFREKARGRPELSPLTALRDKNMERVARNVFGTSLYAICARRSVFNTFPVLFFGSSAMRTYAFGRLKRAMRSRQ